MNDPSVAPRPRPRVLFIDYWTKGIGKFARVVQKAPDEAAYSLLHLGSFRDRSTPRRECLQNIPCTDISAFRGRHLYEILGIFDPDVVVGLNLATLFDRAVILTARRRKIPTVFLQHGSWTDPDEARSMLESLDRGYGVMDRVRRVPKFARLVPEYLRARGSTAFDLGVWRTLIRLARTPTVSHFYPVDSHELRPTLALVFKEKDTETLAATHGLARDRIAVIGNPELDDVARLRERGVTTADRARQLRGLGLEESGPVVCYLEDGFVEQQHCFGWTEQRRVALLEELYAAVRSAGAQLIVRPHPGADPAAMTAAMSGQPGVVVTWKCGLTDAVALADAVVGTISTALETAVILRRPILVPAWHINGQIAACPYLRYGVAHRIDTSAHLSTAIEAAVNGSLAAGDDAAFARARLGPVDGHATARASTRILELAKRHAAERYRLSSEVDPILTQWV